MPGMKRAEARDLIQIGCDELDTLVEMYRLGARRFGLGLRSAARILKQCAARFGETLDV